MKQINEGGEIPMQVDQPVIFTGRKIDVVDIREGANCTISYTDCSSKGEVPRQVTISFEKFEAQLEPILNDLIAKKVEENKNE